MSLPPDPTELLDRLSPRLAASRAWSPALVASASCAPLVGLLPSAPTAELRTRVGACELLASTFAAAARMDRSPATVAVAEAVLRVWGELAAVVGPGGAGPGAPATPPLALLAWVARARTSPDEATRAVALELGRRASVPPPAAPRRL